MHYASFAQTRDDVLGRASGRATTSLFGVVRTVFEWCEPAATAAFVLLEARVRGEDAVLDDDAGALPALLQKLVERAIRRASMRDATVALTARRLDRHVRFEVATLLPGDPAEVAHGRAARRRFRTGVPRVEVEIEVLAGNGERAAVVALLLCEP